MSFGEAEMAAKKIGAKAYVELSAKNQGQVDALFQFAATKAMKK